MPQINDSDEQVFKIDHVVVICNEPVYHVIGKWALWFAVLWICIIFIVYIMEPDVSYQQSIPNKHDDLVYTRNNMFVLLNDDGQQLE